MTSTTDPNNEYPYGWLPKEVVDREMAIIREKSERDKARKEEGGTPCAPWPDWGEVREARRKGIPRPKFMYPVIISSSCPFQSAQDVQRAADLPSLPELKWTVKARRFEEEPEEPDEADKVRYCAVDRGQLALIEDVYDREKVFIWFEGRRRAAFLAHPEKREKQRPGYYQW